MEKPASLGCRHADLSWMQLTATASEGRGHVLKGNGLHKVVTEPSSPECAVQQPCTDAAGASRAAAQA